MASSETCFQFAYQLYLRGEDGGESSCNIDQLGRALALEPAICQAAAEQLKSEGLLEFISFDGDVSLTSFGTAAVMQALADEDQATVYFPPVTGLLPDNNNMQITIDSVNEFIDKISHQAEKMLLDEHERLELDAGISLLEKYIASDNIEPVHLRAGLEKVCRLLAEDSAIE